MIHIWVLFYLFLFFYYCSLCTPTWLYVGLYILC